MLFNIGMIIMLEQLWRLSVATLLDAKRHLT